MNAIRLRTEYLKNPLGIDVKHPRLMWNCAAPSSCHSEPVTDVTGVGIRSFDAEKTDCHDQSADWSRNDRSGARQTAYQIVTDNWDSGKVASSSMWAEYPKGLHDRERVTWKVRLWDENDEPGDWAESFFERGISSWEAKWITGDYTPSKKERYPVDCFRKAFSAAETIKKARLYITACGLYEAKLNGKRVGNFVFAPGYTDYRKRVQYQTCDVTELLQSGENELTVQLGDGWYRGSCGAWGRTCQYGTETKLLAQLEITSEDGSVQTVVTDESWQWSNDGPIRFADNKDGETVEAFRTPQYNGKAKLTRHNVRPTCSNNVPVTEHERFHPTITTAPNGKKLLDFGQNIAGYVAFRVKARVGQRMVWRFGEMLDADGNLTQKNIQLSRKNKTTPLQKIDYTCGEGWNDYKTTFAIFGFRYAEVETDLELNVDDVESIAVYSDLEQTGFFTSSNELLNRFFQATVWSAKGNHLDIPTDCPTRERHGWTGDAQIFFETAGYLFDFAAFSRKWLNDVYDWQEKNGRLPHIVPDGGADFYMRSMNGSVGWADVGILMPYRWAKLFGDETILRRFYDGMAKYARFMEKRCGRTMPIFGEHIKLSPKAGATTIWEAWEGPNSNQGGIGSLNHYSKGAACEWLFKSMCGIRIDGENHFTIVPKPGGHFTYAEARCNSVYGEVESKWVVGDGAHDVPRTITYTITIPANCTASVALPGREVQTVGPGTYTFTEE